MPLMNSYWKYFERSPIPDQGCWPFSSLVNTRCLFWSFWTSVVFNNFGHNSTKKGKHIPIHRCIFLNIRNIVFREIFFKVSGHYFQCGKNDYRFDMGHLCLLPCTLFWIIPTHMISIIMHFLRPKSVPLGFNFTPLIQQSTRFLCTCLLEPANLYFP